MKQPLDYSQLTKRDLQILQMGRAGMLPGIQIAIDLLQEHLDTMKAELYQLQAVLANGHAAETVAQSRRLAAPRKKGWPADAAQGYWGKMTPEERSVEMQRRMALRTAKKAKANHPRNEGHPGHAAWLAKLRKVQQERWNSLSPAAQKRHIKQMLAAREAHREARIVTLEKRA
jgi:hypothetical protein